MSNLTYTGRLPQCGFVGPVTSIRYVAGQGEPFEVDDRDAKDLLRLYPGVLKEEPVAVLAEPMPEPAPVKPERKGKDARSSETPDS